jgi:hypothetical protein
MAEGIIMNNDAKKNDKNRRNTLAGTYTVIKKDTHNYSKFRISSNTCKQKHYPHTHPPKKRP